MTTLTVTTHTQHTLVSLSFSRVSLGFFLGLTRLTTLLKPPGLTQPSTSMLMCQWLDSFEILILFFMTLYNCTL